MMPEPHPGATLVSVFAVLRAARPSYGIHPGRQARFTREWNATMRAEIIAIGSELTSGQSLDTNSR